MNNKILAILVGAVITIGTIGGVAYASNTNDNSFIENQKIATIEGNTNTSQAVIEMINIMRDNGFKDAARYMQTGDYEAMTDYMENLSLEDYDKMIEIMNTNGYGNMGQMMELVGREGMIQMYKSMGSMHGSAKNNNGYNRMMGGIK